MEYVRKERPKENNMIVHIYIYMYTMCKFHWGTSNYKVVFLIVLFWTCSFANTIQT